MNDTMLAAVVTPEKTLEVRSLPLPRFGSYEALVEMRFGATCAGTDQRVIDHGQMCIRDRLQAARPTSCS